MFRSSRSKLDKNTKAPQSFYRFVVLCLGSQHRPAPLDAVATEKVPHEGHHQTPLLRRRLATTDGKYLYVSFGSFGIYCYDFDGNLEWTRDLGQLSTRYGWGKGGAPVIHGSDLVLNWDQEENAALIVLDAKTSTTRWKKELERKEHLDDADDRRAQGQDAGHRQQHQRGPQLRPGDKRALLYNSAA